MIFSPSSSKSRLFSHPPRQHQDCMWKPQVQRKILEWVNQPWNYCLSDHNLSSQGSGFWKEIFTFTNIARNSFDRLPLCPPPFASQLGRTVKVRFWECEDPLLLPWEKFQQNIWISELIVSWPIKQWNIHSTLMCWTTTIIMQRKIPEWVDQPWNYSLSHHYLSSLFTLDHHQHHQLTSTLSSS